MTKKRATLSPRETINRLNVMRRGAMAAFAMAPRNWNFSDPALLRRARKILATEHIIGEPYETAPMVFWYRTPDTEIHCHDWTDQS